MRTESAGQVAVLLAVATLVSLLLVAALSAEAKNTNHTAGKLLLSLVKEANCDDGKNFNSWSIFFSYRNTSII